MSACHTGSGGLQSSVDSSLNRTQDGDRPADFEGQRSPTHGDLDPIGLGVRVIDDALRDHDVGQTEGEKRGEILEGQQGIVDVVMGIPAWSGKTAKLVRASLSARDGVLTAREMAPHMVCWGCGVHRRRPLGWTSMPV